MFTLQIDLWTEVAGVILLRRNSAQLFLIFELHMMRYQLNTHNTLFTNVAGSDVDSRNWIGYNLGWVDVLFNLIKCLKWQCKLIYDQLHKTKLTILKSKHRTKETKFIYNIVILQSRTNDPSSKTDSGIMNGFCWLLNFGELNVTNSNKCWLYNTFLNFFFVYLNEFALYKLQIQITG